MIYRPMTKTMRVVLIGLFALMLGSAAVEAAGPARPPLGTNLARIDDWSTEFPFVDVFKTSRPWISGTWTTWADGQPLDLDAHGWVRSLQPGQMAKTLLFWGQGLRYPSGRYVVTYEGQGTIWYSPNARRVASGPGLDVLDVDSTRGGIMLFITSVNPADYLRNIHVRMPLDVPDGEMFHPVFLDRIHAYRVIRFKDWMATDGGWTPRSPSTQQHWTDRPTVDDARWSNTHGVPVEVMVALANRLGADAWFSMPHLADDDYVQRFAERVLELLDPGLKVYVEYSNEVWNGGYAQAWYAQQQGLALGLSTNPFEARIRYHSRRSREIFGIWENVFPRDRLVRVLGSFASVPWVSETALSYGDTAAHTDALAIAPYFGYPAPQLPHVLGLSLDQLMMELETAVLPQVQTSVRQHAAVAARHGVQLVAYEGGQSLVGDSTYMNDATLNALFDAANRDPRMGALYTRYLADWGAAGGQLFVHYTNVSAYSRYGRFGSLEYMDQPREQAPKYDALQRYIEGL